MLNEAAAVIQSNQYKAEPHISKVAWLLDLERHAKSDHQIAGTSTEPSNAHVLFPDLITTVNVSKLPSSPGQKTPTKYRVPASGINYNTQSGNGVTTRSQAKHKLVYEENSLKKTLGIYADDYIPGAYKLGNMIEPDSLPTPGGEVNNAGYAATHPSLLHEAGPHTKHKSSANIPGTSSLPMEALAARDANTYRRFIAGQRSSEIRVGEKENNRKDVIIASRTTCASVSAQNWRLTTNPYKVCHLQTMSLHSVVQTTTLTQMKRKCLIVCFHQFIMEP